MIFTRILFIIDSSLYFSFVPVIQMQGMILKLEAIIAFILLALGISGHQLVYTASKMSFIKDLATVSTVF